MESFDTASTTDTVTFTGEGQQDESGIGTTDGAQADTGLEVIFGAGSDVAGDGKAEGAGLGGATVPLRAPLPGLSLHITGVGMSGNAYDVEVYAVTSTWKSNRARRGVHVPQRVASMKSR